MQSHILVSLSKRAQCKIAIRIITNTVRSEIRQQKKTQFPASLFARTPILIRVHFSCSMCVVRCVCVCVLSFFFSSMLIHMQCRIGTLCTRNAIGKRRKKRTATYQSIVHRRTV